MRNKSEGLSRREWLQASMAVAAAGGLLGSSSPALAQSTDAEVTGREEFGLKYIVGSCMYGYTPIAEILPEVAKTAATAVDIWPKVHGSQREELDTLGEEAFAAMLGEHAVQLGCITQYKLGPFGLKDEIPLARRLGCSLIVTGAKGPKGLSGDELKVAVRTFIEELQPHLEWAAEHGVTIAIENHGNNLIDSPDSIKWLMDMRPSEHLAVALAPYHLPQDEELLAQLIRHLGNGIAMFYAWQHGAGCMEKLPKEQELLQLPGRGELNFAPLLAALREIDYQGWTEIFMHPVPRGIAILETTAAVTAEINRSRGYLEKLLES
ncbi:MAG: sugar phosphate isomerase/epimerase family protein [Planctomycetaceae bacterium]